MAAPPEGGARAGLVVFSQPQGRVDAPACAAYATCRTSAPACWRIWNARYRRSCHRAAAPPVGARALARSDMVVMAAATLGCAPAATAPSMAAPSRTGSGVSGAATGTPVASART